MECAAHHPGHSRGWTPCCHSSHNKRCPGCGSPGCRWVCSSTAACSPAPPPPDRWRLTAVSERWKPWGKWTETKIQSSFFPCQRCCGCKTRSTEQGCAVPGPETWIVPVLLWVPHGSIEIPDALARVQGQPGLMSLGAVGQLQEMTGITPLHPDSSLCPQPQLHTYLGGHALPLRAVFLVRKCLQLSQIQHGLDHYLQRAYAPWPTPPRSLRGVRGDVADDTMLEKEADMMQIKTIPGVAPNRSCGIFYPRNEICKEADWISKKKNPLRKPCVSEWISRSFL